MSDFQKMPNQHEVMQIDPKWFEDMQLAHEIFSHKKNDSLVMRLADQFTAYQEAPTVNRLGDLEAWKRGDVNILEYIDGLTAADE